MTTEQKEALAEMERAIVIAKAISAKHLLKFRDDPELMKFWGHIRTLLSDASYLVETATNTTQNA